MFQVEPLLGQPTVERLQTAWTEIHGAKPTPSHASARRLARSGRGEFSLLVLALDLTLEVFVSSTHTHAWPHLVHAGGPIAGGGHTTAGGATIAGGGATAAGG